MGTWGEGPFDNDAAGDLVAGMMKSINKVVEKDDRYSYEAARACAQFVLAAHGTDILGGPGLAPLIRALARIRMNREWVGGFRRPRKIASALNRELEAVLERTRTCKGCKKSIDKSERHALESLVEPLGVSRYRSRRDRSDGSLAPPGRP